MLFFARWHTFSKTFIFLLFIVLLSLFITTRKASAQTITPTINEEYLRYHTPDLNPDVPHNMHTLAQSAMIEVISAGFCILTGIDITNPNQGCLDIDPHTHKLGFLPPAQSQMGGVLGGLINYIPNLFGQLYTPPASSSQYISYLKNNFGIIQPAYAQQPTGFDSLKSLLPMWRISLNIAYIFLMLVFITIGLAIMLRVHIDPRTVMSVQNQIPKIVICILLTTFSFAIAGLMIDAMWLLLYTGINVITDSANSTPRYVSCALQTKQNATHYLMENPITYMNEVVGCDHTTNYKGLAQVTDNAGRQVGTLVGQTIGGMLKQGAPCGQDGTCTIATIIQWTVTFIAWIIVIFALMIALFKVWFSLLKAYIMVIIYVVTGPIMIVMGLLPGKPLGFEKWLKRMFVALVVFPATAILFVAASLITTVYADANINERFIPPLTGRPSADFAWIIAFGMIMVSPKLLTILQTSLQTSTKEGEAASGAVFAGAAAGGSIPGNAVSNTWGMLTKRDDMSGRPIGALARWAQNPNAGFLTRNLIQRPRQWLWGVRPMHPPGHPSGEGPHRL